MCSDVVAAARSYLGTPYQHQARLKGVAVDCVGLILCVGRDLGHLPEGFDYSGYGRVPDGVLLRQRLEKHLREVPQSEMRPGDVVCIAFAKHPQHVGILGDYRHGGLSIIHAAMPPGRVIETRLLFGPVMQFRAAYRFPETPWHS